MHEILGLKIPEGQSLWFWDCGGNTGHLLIAKDADEAYRKALACRLNGETDPEAVKDHIRWFNKNDELVLIEAEYTGPAFVGPLPDPDEEESELPDSE